MEYTPIQIYLLKQPRTQTRENSLIDFQEFVSEIVKRGSEIFVILLIILKTFYKLLDRTYTMNVIYSCLILHDIIVEVQERLYESTVSAV